MNDKNSDMELAKSLGMIDDIEKSTNQTTQPNETPTPAEQETATQPVVETPKETPKEEVKETKEDNTLKDTKETKEIKYQGIPPAKYQELKKKKDSELAEKESKIAELTKIIEQSQNQAIPQQERKQDLEEFLSNSDLDEGQKDFLRGFANIANSDVKKELESLKALREQWEEQNQSKEYNKAFDYIFDNSIKPLVEKEHGNLSKIEIEAVKNRLKEKYENLDESLPLDSLHFLYKAEDEFRPVKKKHTAESPTPTPKTNVVDMENITQEDVDSGRVSIQEAFDWEIKKWKEKERKG